MNLYLFEDCENISCNYHSGGGLVIIAENGQQAIELASQDKDIKLSDEEWSKVQIFPLRHKTQPRVIVFPNAGCC